MVCAIPEPNDKIITMAGLRANQMPCRTLIIATGCSSRRSVAQDYAASTLPVRAYRETATRADLRPLRSLRAAGLAVFDGRSAITSRREVATMAFSEDPDRVSFRSSERSLGQVSSKKRTWPEFGQQRILELPARLRWAGLRLRSAPAVSTAS